MSLPHTRPSGKLRRIIRRYCGAFTLIEMLVVMAIIGMLAGMLLPVLAKARESGRRAVCTSNLGQIGKTLAIYCGQTDDYLPSWGCYGSTQATISPGPGSQYGNSLSPIVNYAGHQAPSRHMVVGCSFEIGGTGWGPDINGDILPRNANSLSQGEPAANFLHRPGGIKSPAERIDAEGAQGVQLSAPGGE